MKNHPITITYKKEKHLFSISDHPHHDGDRCRYKVFEDGQLVASFNADAQQFLHLCQNPGNLEKKLIHALAAKMEKDLPHPGSKHFSN